VSDSGVKYESAGRGNGSNWPAVPRTLALHRCRGLMPAGGSASLPRRPRRARACGSWTRSSSAVATACAALGRLRTGTGPANGALPGAGGTATARLQAPAVTCWHPASDPLPAALTSLAVPPGEAPAVIADAPRQSTRILPCFFIVLDTPRPDHAPAVHRARLTLPARTTASPLSAQADRRRYTPPEGRSSYPPTLARRSSDDVIELDRSGTHGRPRAAVTTSRLSRGPGRGRGELGTLTGRDVIEAVLRGVTPHPAAAPGLSDGTRSPRPAAKRPRRRADCRGAGPAGPPRSIRVWSAGCGPGGRHARARSTQATFGKDARRST
jgi:hypothetical protein